MSGPFSQRKKEAFAVDAWIQFKLLRLAAFHPETTKADITALAEIIQRYWGRYGNGFVSDQEICVLTGLTERTVRRARKNLARLGFVTVVRAGGRGHATVYTPNFGMVQQKEDIPVLDKKADIPVLLTDENVRLNGELQDRNVRPSYLQTGLQTGHLKDRPDCAAPTAPAGAGPLGAAPPETAQEASLLALLAAYSPADMSKPARAAYKRAWEAIHVDTDLATVIAAAADWHQSWGAQNNPNAPRMSLVRWLKDEMYFKPAPKGFNRVERQAKGATKNTATTSEPTARTMKITKAKESGNPFGGNFYVDVDFEDDTAIISRKYHILQKDGVGPDNETWQSLVRAVGDVKFGRLVGVERDGENLTFSTIDQPDYVEPPLPSPPSAPMTEAEKDAVRAKVAALPPLAPHLNKWQRLKEERCRRDENDEEDDEDEGWPDWMDADQEDEAA